MGMIRNALLAWAWMAIAPLAPQPQLPPTPTPAASPSPAPSPTPSPTPALPSPTPTPVDAAVDVSPAIASLPGTVTVTGSQFLPNQRITLLWDNSANKPVGIGTADGQGKFSIDTKLPADATPGSHQICVAEVPGKCARLSLTLAAASPSPSPTPTPSPSPTPSTAPPVTGDRGSGVGFLFQPPFVIFPVLLLL